MKKKLEGEWRDTTQHRRTEIGRQTDLSVRQHQTITNQRSGIDSTHHNTQNSKQNQSHFMFFVSDDKSKTASDNTNNREGIMKRVGRISHVPSQIVGQSDLEMEKGKKERRRGKKRRHMTRKKNQTKKNKQEQRKKVCVACVPICLFERW
jgi:hypothetical protein